MKIAEDDWQDVSCLPVALDHDAVLAADAEVGVLARHEALPRLLGDVLVQVTRVNPEHRRHGNNYLKLSQISDYIYISQSL